MNWKKIGWLDDWKKIQWNFITWKRGFLQSPKHGRISDADYTHEKGVCKDFAITNIVEYLDLYVHSDSFLLVNISENFWNVCLEMCGLEPACLLDAPGLAWQAALKRPT